MAKKRNRALSFVLALAFMFTLVLGNGITVFAAEADEPAGGQCTCEALCADEAANGECAVCGADPGQCQGQPPAEDAPEEEAEATDEGEAEPAEPEDGAPPKEEVAAAQEDAGPYSGGDGTEGEPYQISEVADLALLATTVNDGTSYEGVYFELTGALDLGGAAWTPIGHGSSSPVFKGSFDGGGHAITGLAVDTEGENLAGLFGYIQNATLANLHVTGSVSGRQSVGGIVGYNYGGTVKNCSFAGAVTSTLTGGMNNVGGLVGSNGAGSTVENSYNTATVTAADINAGGVVGYNNAGATVKNCYNTGTVSGSGDKTGGVVGQSTGAASIVEGCYNTGAVTGAGAQTGGVVGTCDNSTVKNCYNTGAVTGTGGTQVGGVVGSLSNAADVVDSCYNTGSVSSAYNYVGGVVGFRMYGAATIKNSLSLGAQVTGISGGNDIKRIVGTAGDVVLENNQARADQLVNGEALAAGTGAADNQNGADLAVDTGIATAFTGWDPAVWTIAETGALEDTGLPVLTANPQSPAPRMRVGAPGTAGNPKGIGGSDDLAELSGGVRDGSLDTEGMYFELTGNLSLESFGEWMPIGTSTTPFKGNFNGGGYEITGLSITGAANNVGLFGYIDGATLTGLNVSGSVAGGQSVGGLVGNSTNSSTVTNSSFSGTVSATGLRAGGLVGYNQGGTVQSCYNTGAISGSGRVGGVVGYGTGTVQSCYNTGAISGSGRVGGVVGYGTGAGTVKDCYSTGNIVAGTEYAGGIAGIVDGTTNVSYCYNTGTVEITSGRSAGGILGLNNGSVRVTNCVSLGLLVCDNSTNSALGRISGNATGGNATNNNKARADQLVGTSGQYAFVTTGSLADKNGADVTMEDTLASVFTLSYTGESTWDPAVWTVGEGTLGGGSLPTLAANPQSGAAPLPTHQPGTVGNPHTVDDADALADLATEVAGGEGFAGQHFLLDDGIDLEEAEWTPIGDESNPFKGTFNGGGNTIEGLKITGENSDVGLFGYIDGATIKNLTVKGKVTGAANVGGLVGNNQGGTVENCAFEGDASGGSNVGGLVGQNNGGTVENSSNSGTVTGMEAVAGGLVGNNAGGGTVKNSRNAATVDGVDNVGGVAGQNTGSGSTIASSYSTGAVTGTNDKAGGVVGGNAGGGTVKNSYSTGAVAGKTSVGGVAGYNAGTMIIPIVTSTVEGCYSTGTVSGQAQVGGVVGANGSSVTVKDNLALSARVTGGTNVGRVMGTLAVPPQTNTARDDMIFGAEGGEDTATVLGETVGSTTKHGASAASDALLADVFSGLDNTVWNIPGEGSLGEDAPLPTLKGATQSPAPALPAAAAGASTLPPSITTTSLEGGKVRAAYSQALAANGAAITWSIESGDLPGGLALNASTGIISGTPTQEGTFTFTVKAENTLGSDTKELSIAVAEKDPFGGGEGTSEAPYMLSEAADLAELAGEVAGGEDFEDEYFELEEDIALSGEWTPIGGDTTPFNGTLDGGGNTISGLSVTGDDDDVGLFGAIGAEGAVENLKVRGEVAGGSNVGGLAGKNAGKVKGVSYTGNVAGAAAGDTIGGLVGNNTGTIEDSRFAGNVSGGSNVGGLAGVNDGTSSGGSGGKVTGSYATGKVSGENVVGGAVGKNHNFGEVRHVYTTSAVTGTGRRAGGVVGLNDSDATVANCFATGSVSGTGDVGSIAGENADGATVENNVALGLKVTATEPTAGATVGRVVGTNISSTLQGNRARKDMKAGVAGSEAPVASGTGDATIHGQDVETDAEPPVDISTVFPAASGWDSDVWTIPAGDLVGGAPLPTLANAAQSPAPALPASSPDFEGGGTEDDPYQITDAALLGTLADNVNAGTDYSGLYFTLDDDIELSGEWTPIGGAKAFKGTFDGGGNTISGLSITSGNNDAGLFGYTHGATVKNLTVKGEVAGGSFAGGLVGNSGTGTVIENCAFEGDVSGGSSVGGLVGSGMGGTIEGSYASGTVTGTDERVGGLVGANNGGTIKNSYNAAAVTGKKNVGGLAGNNSGTGGTTDGCYNIGTVAGEENVGGLAGNVATGNTLENSLSLGAKVTADTNPGRVVGNNAGTLQNNAARADQVFGEEGGEDTAEALEETVGAGTVHGADIEDGALLADIFGGFDGAVWNLPGEGALEEDAVLPTLKEVVQDPGPTLPAAESGASGDSVPAITTASLAGGTVNLAYTATLKATGAKPITWGLAGGSLPTGLSLNSTTGVLSGTPTREGTFAFTVKAENANGSGTKQFTLTVEAGPSAPVYTTQPQGASAVATETATFTVATESESAVAYRWQERIDGVWTDINTAIAPWNGNGEAAAKFEGHTTATLTITGVHLSDSTRYFRAAATNEVGTSYSEGARLTVTALEGDITLSQRLLVIPVSSTGTLDIEFDVNLKNGDPSQIAVGYDVLEPTSRAGKPGFVTHSRSGNTITIEPISGNIGSAILRVYCIANPGIWAECRIDVVAVDDKELAAYHPNPGTVTAWVNRELDPADKAAGGAGSYVGDVTLWRDAVTDSTVAASLRGNKLDFMKYDKQTKTYVTDDDLNALFRLVAVDDNRVQLVKISTPTKADGVTANWKSKYTTYIRLSLADDSKSVVSVNALTIKIDKRLPTIKAGKVNVNTWLDDRTAGLAFTGGEVLSITGRDDSSNAKKRANDALLGTNAALLGDGASQVQLDGNDLTLTVNTQSAKISNKKLYLMVEVEGWGPRPVAVTLNAKNTPLAVKPSKTSITPYEDTSRSAGITLNLLPKAENTKYADLGVTDLALVTNNDSYLKAGYGLDFNKATGSFTITGTGSTCPKGALLFEVSYADSAKKEQFTIKVTPKTVAGTSLKLKPAKTTVLLNPRIAGGDSATIPMGMSQADYTLQPGDFDTPKVLNSKGKALAEGVDPLVAEMVGTDLVLTTKDNATPGTYKVTVPSSLKAKPSSTTTLSTTITVKVANPTADVGMKLTAKGSLDLTKLTAVTLTMAPGNSSATLGSDQPFTISRSKKGDPISADDMKAFEVTRLGSGQWTLELNPDALNPESGLGIATGTYYVSVREQAIAEDGGIKVTSNEVKFTVKVSKVKVSRTPASGTLYRNDGYSEIMVNISLPAGTPAIQKNGVTVSGTKGNHYEVTDLGGGRYALGFKDDEVKTGIKAGSVKLEIRLAGNSSAKAPLTTTVKVALKTFK